jgi:acyl-CoA hydrolase
VVVVGDGPGTPAVDPSRAARQVGVDEAALLLGWMVDQRCWIESLGPVPAATYQPANALAPAARAGRVRYLPVRLASIPALLAGPLRPAVAVVSGVARGSGYAFADCVGYADAAARLARAVVVQVSEGPDLGAPVIEGPVARVVDGGERAQPPPERDAGTGDQRIAEAAAALIPEGATVQYGLGRLPEAVVRSLSVPVAVVSGLVTDALAELAERNLLIGEALASYVWSRHAPDLVADGRLRLVGLEELHRGARMASTPRFVAVNTALEVGLDGAVNVERIGPRVVAGIGGHADYCAAAAQSAGGLSIIVLPAAHGERSSIVPVPSVVSTARSDVHVVVTEHGVADLRGLDERERAAALLGIADPLHRPSLESAVGRP